MFCCTAQEGRRPYFRPLVAVDALLMLTAIVGAVALAAIPSVGTLGSALMLSGGVVGATLLTIYLSMVPKKQAPLFQGDLGEPTKEQRPCQVNVIFNLTYKIVTLDFSFYDTIETIKQRLTNLQNKELPSQNKVKAGQPRFTYSLYAKNLRTNVETRLENERTFDSYEFESDVIFLCLEEGLKD